MGGHRHEPHKAEAQLRKKRTTTNSNLPAGHHTTLPKTPDDMDVRAKTPSSPLVLSSPTMTHTELACCQAGLAAVGRYEPCSRHSIGSACAACQDDVPHRTSHRQVGLAAIVRCKLPNQRVSSCLWRSQSRSRPPRTRRVQLPIA